MRSRAGLGFLTLLVLGILISSCGQASSPSQNAGTSTTGAEGNDAASMTPGYSGQTTHAQVTLTLNKMQFGAEDPVIVTVHNGLTQTIWLSDSKTGCPSVVLERQVNGQWQPVKRCALGPKPRSTSLSAGSEKVVQLDATTGIDTGAGWPAGTYRATMSYTTDQAIASAQTLILSTQFFIS